MKIVGLAGPAGSGKSSVACEMTRQPGVVWIDLDPLAWRTYKQGTATYHELVARFGDRVLKPDGTIDRARLADIALHDPRRRDALHRIVHPAVLHALKERIARLPVGRTRLVLVEGALLAQLPASERQMFDCIVWLEADATTRIHRLTSQGRPQHAERTVHRPPQSLLHVLDADRPLNEVVDALQRLVQSACS